MLVSRLTECSWSLLWILYILINVLAWSWYLKLKTLPIEYLIVVESWRCSIKSNSFSSVCLIVWGSGLSSPFLGLSYIGNYTTWTYSSRIISDIHSWAWFVTACWLSSLLFLCFKDSNMRILSIYFWESISGRFKEHTLCIRSIIIDYSGASLPGLIILLQIIEFLFWTILIISHCIILLYFK